MRPDMQKLSAANLASLVNQLDKRVDYQYLNPRNKGLIRIVDVALPEGPIRVKRWTPSKGETASSKETETISTEMLWRVANACQPEHPINLDRILGASYNTRSVLEALLVHTPVFYGCYPGRIESTGGSPKVKRGHKHIMWMPDDPHRSGIPEMRETDRVISEIPSMEVVYDSLSLPDTVGAETMDIDTRRRHSQIQIALYFIGLQLGFRTWIAQNDKGIVYRNKRLAEFEGVIQSLQDVQLMASFQDAIRAALLIDCIWFKNGKLMPAVMEVEHTTGITSGLTRMQHFKTCFPPILTRYVIVAPDEDREKVVREANKEQFRDLQARFFPYSAVEELYAICISRKLRGVTEEFLDCYMEPAVV